MAFRDLHLARFDLDATPPTGHPLCGGWIRPVEAVDDPLKLRGVAILGAGLPIVLAALDYTGVQNESHRLFTEALAEAARTTPDRVALHCVHQHNAPFVDRRANALLRAAGVSPLVHDDRFIDELVRRAAAEVRKAVDAGVPMSHVRHGEAQVHQVACNRRAIGPDGRIRFTRTSATKNPEARAEPEGTIDPWIRSVAFCRGDRVLARLYYYATHPMSYYGDGRVTADFVGLARSHRDADEPDALHVYFTGCAGDVTAGKYNDGGHAQRSVLASRMLDGMRAADADADKHPLRLERLGWAVEPFDFRVREDLDPKELEAKVAKSDQTAERNRSALTCAWLERAASGRPILLQRLTLDDARILHLPAETFVEYQLHAVSTAPDRFTAVAAYGDGGPWYIPLARSYAEGGYEPSVSWVSPTTEPRYRQAIDTLLARVDRIE